MAVEEVKDENQAQRLADYLMGKRVRPTVVISSAQTLENSWIPARQVAEDLAGIADVYWMRNGETTWAFAKYLPPDAQVFGDAGRVYRVENEWIKKPSTSRIYLAFGPKDGSEIAERLSAEALHNSMKHGLLEKRTVSDVPIVGKVKGSVAGRAMVQHSGGIAIVNPELVLDGLAIDQLVQAKQEVRGLLNTETSQLNLRDSVQSAEAALAHYREGDVVLGRVAEVSPSQAVIELYPGVRTTIQIAQITGNPLDSADDLMSVGEVVAARVQRIGPKWLLNMSDVDDDEIPAAPPSLLPGGPVLWVMAETSSSEAIEHLHLVSLEFEDEALALEEASVEFEVTEPIPQDAEQPQVVEEPRTFIPTPAMLDPKNKGKLPKAAPVPAQPAAYPAPSTPISTDDKHSVKHMTGVIERLKAEVEAARKRESVAKLENRQLMQRAAEWQNKYEHEKAQTKRLRTQQRTSVQRAKQDARSGKIGDELAFNDPEAQFRLGGLGISDSGPS